MPTLYSTWPRRISHGNGPRQNRSPLMSSNIWSPWLQSLCSWTTSGPSESPPTLLMQPLRLPCPSSCWKMTSSMLDTEIPDQFPILPLTSSNSSFSSVSAFRLYNSYLLVNPKLCFDYFSPLSAFCFQIFVLLSSLSNILLIPLNNNFWTI